MKNYKIDKTKNIGNVIYIVEGGRPGTGGTELRLLKKIFADILGYEVQELRRGSDEFIGYGSNPQYRVFALNLPKNQLTQLNEDSLDELFCRLNEDFHIKPEDCPIFFLYDRDYLSYKHNELRGGYVKKYTDPYGDEQGNQGQLLLSYPAVESYLISCIQNEVYQKSCFLAKDLKAELRKALFPDMQVTSEILHQETVNSVFSRSDISPEDQLIHAAQEMDEALAYFGMEEYDLDHLAPTLLGVYEGQQEKYITEGVFSLMSLVSLSLLELGIITESDDE